MRKEIKLIGLAAMLAGVLLFSGCSSLLTLFDAEGEGLESPPQVMAQEGLEQLRAENYRSAADTFQKLKDRYPYSKYAILAELKMGDALYLKELYLEALDAYQEFEQLHPNNEAVPYVVYQQGMCHFQMMKGHMRDQAHTVKAIQTFFRLQEQYPNSPFTSKAQARLATAKSNLAGHEFYVGEFYYNMGAYKAALGRFTSLIRSYPDTGYHARALEFIKICQEKMAAQQTAAVDDDEEMVEEEYETDAPSGPNSDTSIEEALEKPEPTRPEPLTGVEQ